MIKGHMWLPDSVYDFFKWKLPSVWPKSDYGTEMILFDYNPFHSTLYTGNYIYITKILILIAWWT